MEHDGLHQRGRGLEEAFFADANRHLLERLRATPTAAEIADYAATSGITDAATIAHLVALGLAGEAAAALVLVPLAEMAWADGELHDDERARILEAAAGAGIPLTAPCHDLFAASLRRRPGRDLFDRWKGLVASLTRQMSRRAIGRLRNDIVGRARTIAEARPRAGGRGGMSVGQREILDEVDAAFPA